MECMEKAINDRITNKYTDTRSYGRCFEEKVFFYIDYGRVYTEIGGA